MSICPVPGTALSALHVLIHLIFIEILRRYYYPRLADEETEAHKSHVIIYQVFTTEFMSVGMLWVTN